MKDATRTDALIITIFLLTVALFGMFSAFIDARKDYLEEKREHDKSVQASLDMQKELTAAPTRRTNVNGRSLRKKDPAMAAGLAPVPVAQADGVRAE